MGYLAAPAPKLDFASYRELHCVPGPSGVFCRLCPRLLSRSTTLRRHYEEVHGRGRGGVSFRCPVCRGEDGEDGGPGGPGGARFHRRGFMRHVRVHHPELRGFDPMHFASKDVD